MGVDTKGILIGNQTAESVAAIIRNYGAGIGDVEVEHLGSPYGGELSQFASARIYFTDPDAAVNQRRMLYIHWNSGDNADVYAGERTQVSLGAFGSAVPVIEDIISHFGGFLCENDSKEVWRAVDAKPGVEINLTPLDQLSIDIGQSLGGKEAAVLREVAADPDKLASVMEAFDRYRASLDAVKAPGL